MFSANSINIKDPVHSYYTGNGTCVGFTADAGFRVYPGEQLFIGAAGRYYYNEQNGINLGGPGVYLTAGYSF